MNTIQLNGIGDRLKVFRLGRGWIFVRFYPGRVLGCDDDGCG